MITSYPHMDYVRRGALVLASLALSPHQARAGQVQSVPHTGLSGIEKKQEQKKQAALPNLRKQVAINNCASNLTRAAGIRVPATVFTKHLPMRKDQEFLEYLLAVMFVESKFRTGARSHRDAYGLMQMTAPATVEVVGKCGLLPISTMEDMFQARVSIPYGACFLQKLLRDTDGDYKRALILYNGGPRQLIKYDRGVTMASETEEYVQKVESALAVCRLGKAE